MKTSCNSNDFNSTDTVRRAIAALIAVTSINLSLASLPAVLASPRPGIAVATGMMSVAGSVTVDGERAASGQTIFPGSHIATSEGSESIIDLGKFTRLLLSPETELTLDFSRTNISGLLGKGLVRGFIPAGLPVNIRTAGAELITDSNQPTAFSVQVDGDTTKVSVETGRVEVLVGNELQTVGVGEVFATASDSPAQAALQNNLTNRRKVGLFAAIGAAVAILAIALTGRHEVEPDLDFGGCVIVSGERSSFCP